MADNGAFGGTWDPDRWRRWLARDQPRAGCLAAVCPDVVADAAATLELFDRYVGTLVDLRYPVALAAQDGLTATMVPWDAIDCLFVGGTTEWKLSETAHELAERPADTASGYIAAGSTVGRDTAPGPPTPTVATAASSRSARKPIRTGSSGGSTITTKTRNSGALCHNERLMEERAIRPPSEPNDNTPAEGAPGTVGPPTATPGDPNGVEVIDEGPGTPPPGRSLRAARVVRMARRMEHPGVARPALVAVDTAWACLDLNASRSSAPCRRISSAPHRPCPRTG